jgi:signal transduction histidine kinase
MRHTDAVETLLSDLAFEVKNVLIAVPALIDGLREEIGKIVEASSQDRQEFKERWVNDLNFLTDHAQRLIGRAREVRLHTQPSQCALQNLIEKILESLRSIAEKNGISIECQGAEGLPTVHAYEWRLQTLFSYPIMRAINVTQPGGSVTILGRVDEIRELALIHIRICSSCKEHERLHKSMDAGSLSTALKVLEQHIQSVFR